MKTNNKILGLLLTIVVTMASCSKDNGGDGIFGSDKLLLIESRLNDNISARYEYDNQNRIVRLYTHDEAGQQELTTTYTYSSDGLLEVTEMKDADGVVQMKEEYTYEEGNKPTRMTTFSGNTAIITNFTYSQHKMEEKRTINLLTSVMTYTYDTKGNVLSMETSLNGAGMMLIEMGDYDDRNRPDIYGSPFGWRFPGAHNHQSSKTTLLSTEQVLEDRVWKYTYNNDGYPTKAEVSDRATNELVETHSYAYQKAH